MADAAAAAAPVRWGVLGSGMICSDFVQSLRSTRGAVVAAVAARSLDKAKKFAEANGIPTAYGSYDELMAADIDIVYIGTIHTAHKDQAIACMKAGKAVLCEKPMTCSKSDTEELVRVAREQKVLLAEGLWTRYFPCVTKAREIIASGGIGKVVSMHGDFGFRFPDVENSSVVHRLTDPKMAGGATLDIGVYPLSCMLLAFGSAAPKTISAAGVLTEQTRVDKSVGVTVVSATGQVASLHWTIECQTPEEWRIMGTEGMIIFEGPAHVPTKMRVIKPGATRMDPPSEEVVSIAAPALIEGANPLNFPGSEGFQYQAAAVTAAVRDKLRECAEFTLEESVTMAGITDEILRQVGVVYPWMAGK